MFLFSILFVQLRSEKLERELRELRSIANSGGVTGKFQVKTRTRDDELKFALVNSGPKYITNFERAKNFHKGHQ